MGVPINYNYTFDIIHIGMVYDLNVINQCRWIIEEIY